MFSEKRAGGACAGAFPVLVVAVWVAQPGSTQASSWAPPIPTSNQARSIHETVTLVFIRSIPTTMREDQHRFLSLLGQTPARLTVEQTAWLLNCQPHDIPVLIVARVLKPLGNPQPNSVKYFAAAEIMKLSKDRAWLARLTTALSQHWQKKNRRKVEQIEFRSSGNAEGINPSRAAAG